jgi:hypothetical protein
MQPQARILSACFIAMALASASMAASDPFTGTWDLDRTASNSRAQSQVLTFDVAANREAYSSELVLPDGTRQVTHYRAAYDGKKYPSETTVTKPDGTRVVRMDSVILKRTGPRSEERHWVQHGRVAVILRRSVSADGNTLSSTMINVDSGGQEHIGGHLVFKRRL